MKKIYLLSQGCYSDYSIITCFSTKEKAEECKKFLIENKENRDLLIYDIPTIEEYILDAPVAIKTVLIAKLQSPILNPSLKEEKIETWSRQYLAWEKSGEGTEIIDKILYIRRNCNPNKSLESERNRIKKVAYDTLKKINYLIKVEKVKLEDINKYLVFKREDIKEYIELAKEEENDEQNNE